VGIGTSIVVIAIGPILGSSYQRRRIYRDDPGDTVVEERHEVF
jgi:hypothetical protein